MGAMTPPAPLGLGVCPVSAFCSTGSPQSRSLPIASSTPLGTQGGFADGAVVVVDPVDATVVVVLWIEADVVVVFDDPGVELLEPFATPGRHPVPIGEPCRSTVRPPISFGRPTASAMHRVYAA